MNTNKDKRHNKDSNVDRRDNRKAKLALKRLDSKHQKRMKGGNEDE
jgi:hypothetical protein